MKAIIFSIFVVYFWCFILFPSSHFYYPFFFFLRAFQILCGTTIYEGHSRIDIRSTQSLIHEKKNALLLDQQGI